MANKKYSFSRIETFDNCPRMFKFKYLDEIPESITGKIVFFCETERLPDIPNDEEGRFEVDLLWLYQLLMDNIEAKVSQIDSTFLKNFQLKPGQKRGKKLKPSLEEAIDKHEELELSLLGQENGLDIDEGNDSLKICGDCNWFEALKGAIGKCRNPSIRRNTALTGDEACLAFKPKENN